mmetsp:Transcript_5604/g.13353  ORF Transcript_5604/g.13353 Transcript_5604/m.13353 type:complete len:228 (-) Transcript_5604:785-1468(-)
MPIDCSAFVSLSNPVSPATSLHTHSHRIASHQHKTHTLDMAEPLLCAEWAPNDDARTAFGSAVDRVSVRDYLDGVHATAPGELFDVFLCRVRFEPHQVQIDHLERPNLRRRVVELLAQHRRLKECLMFLLCGCVEVDPRHSPGLSRHLRHCCVLRWGHGLRKERHPVAICLVHLPLSRRASGLGLRCAKPPSNFGPRVHPVVVDGHLLVGLHCVHHCLVTKHASFLE